MGERIAGAGTSTPLRAADDLAKQYGGSPNDWVKMASPTFRDADGFGFATHWYENLVTGVQVE